MTCTIRLYNPCDGPFTVWETGSKRSMLEVGDGRPAYKAPTVSSRVVCPDLHSFVACASPVCHQPAVLDEGRHSRYGRLIKAPVELEICSPGTRSFSLHFQRKLKGASATSTSLTAILAAMLVSLHPASLHLPAAGLTSCQTHRMKLLLQQTTLEASVGVQGLEPTVETEEQQSLR
ncbi:hypothetical protein D4764_0047550 [Takifugu flavidus]|uniref:Uncharacterized protein n=1 Tax=Takifugu flavidus TaxID=433684 RepID=A0A5C6MJ91_9TELE|nr:hypothetical protein D4764_0047550 [Takifugu flavidus]